MNKVNIRKAIAIMQRHQKAARPLDMRHWQTVKEDMPVITEEKHLCGTPCCLLGYIAVSPEFIADGGYMCEVSISPWIKLDGKLYHGSDALREWFEISYTQAKSLTVSDGGYWMAYGEICEKDITYGDVIYALCCLVNTGKLPCEE